MSRSFWNGKRVLVRACMRKNGFDSLENIWMASDFDGAFAEYVKVPASEVFAVDCDWSDAELATIPCAYGTAENMQILDQLTEFARRWGHTLADLAIAWLLAEPAVASVMTGASKVEHIVANARAASWKLSQEEVAEVRRILGDEKPI